MAEHRAETTATEYPWQAVIRTVFEALVGLAAMAPLIYSAATQGEPGQAVGWVGVALAISGAITRVMALPGVEAWLQRFLPFLAAAPGDMARKADLRARQREDGSWDATPPTEPEPRPNG